MDDAPTGPEPLTNEPRPAVDPSIEGPLSIEQARALLDRGAELLEAGEYLPAARHYQRVIGHPDAAATAAAFLGLGEALFRLDRDDDALAAWDSVLKLPETPATYLAWRNVAAARVRAGDLVGAITAYREAERRAPADERAEIAARLGWLAKETGDAGAARRYFARARGEGPALPLTWIVVGVTVIVSVSAWSGDGAVLYRALELDKGAVAAGEYWRLWTATLLHATPPFGYMHLFFNMYALYLAGSLIERMYGSALFGLFYLLCAAAGSVASFVFGGDLPSVGASGAIFGLFGVLLAVSRVHRPVVAGRARALLGQIGPIVAINLVFGLLNAGFIDNSAHVGGLLGGLWLGYLIAPRGVPTLAGLWQRPSPTQGTLGPAGGEPSSAGVALRALGVIALVVVLAVGVLVGTQARRGTSGGTSTGAADGAAMTVTDATGATGATGRTA